MEADFELLQLKLQSLLLIGNVTRERYRREEAKQEANQVQDIYACLLTHVLEDQQYRR